MKHSLLCLHPEDSVAVALQDLAKAHSLNSLGLEHCRQQVTQEAISGGHKVALKNIKAGDWVIKYQQIIGRANCDIAIGEHVHSHNLDMAKASELSTSISGQESITHDSNTDLGFEFMGYERAGSNAIGTRNAIAVVTTVSCANSVARRIAKTLSHEIEQHYPGIDAAVALCHSGGCAINARGTGLEVLQRSLNGWIKHPNFAAVLLVSLGCETNQIDSLLATGGLETNERLQTLVIQDSGGSLQAIEKGIEKIRPQLQQWNQAKRSRHSLDKLTVALQCGGSDGYSGLSANPALGLAMDKLISQGGTTILAETPEIFGAEHLLQHRCREPELAHKIQEKVDWWQAYAAREGESLDHNPSHGNKAGGLTTILEKSLGAVAKAGSSQVCGVYDYAETIQESGLVFMDSPGYDPVSITGQVASGANMICFTTGRGSNYGNPAVPCLKLASNSQLAQRMADDMDINCGRLLDGELSLNELADDILERIIAVASGQPSASEALQLEEECFLPWTLGAVL